MELMNSSDASFASCFNVSGIKPQQPTEARWETPCVLQLSRQHCHPCHAPRHKDSWGLIRVLSVTAGKTLVPLSGPSFVSAPLQPCHAGPGRAGMSERGQGHKDKASRRFLGCEGGTEPGVGDPGARCGGTMIPVLGSTTVG